MKINHGYQQCFLNYGEVYARAAQRLMLAGEDSQSQLDRARQNLATARKLGIVPLDSEQFSVLADLVDASLRLRRKRVPMPALQSLRAALPRCPALGKTDAVRQTLAAQGHLLEAEWVGAVWEILSPHSAKRTARPAWRHRVRKCIPMRGGYWRSPICDWQKGPRSRCGVRM